MSKAIKISRILRAFAKLLGLTELASGVDVTPVPSSGFASWERVKALGWGLARTLGKPLTIGAVYDRDYHSAEEIDAVLAELRANITFAHIHQRKEIENYLLVPNVLQRAAEHVLNERFKDGRVLRSSVADVLERVTAPLKHRVQAHYVGERSQYLRSSGLDISTINQATLEWFERKWSTLDTRMEVVGGKEVLSLLRGDLQANDGVSLTTNRIVRSFRRDEVPPDLADLLGGLEAFRTQHVL